MKITISTTKKFIKEKKEFYDRNRSRDSMNADILNALSATLAGKICSMYQNEDIRMICLERIFKATASTIKAN